MNVRVFTYVNMLFICVYVRMYMPVWMYARMCVYVCTD